MTNRDCEHGQLARSCHICSLEQEVASLKAELEKLRTIESAARNLAKVKGRHNSEIAMNQLLEALK